MQYVTYCMGLLRWGLPGEAGLKPREMNYFALQ